MRLGMLTQWFDPEEGPAALPGVYAREFIRQSHQVDVLTGFPNYPSGTLYPGYSLKARLRENREGVNVVRTPLYPNHGQSGVGRILNYSTFALSATFMGLGSLSQAEAIWVYNSPPTVSLPLLTHTKFGKTPFFLHVQDLWPESMIHSGMIGARRVRDVAAAAVRMVVRLTEKRAAVIGVISPHVRELILERNPGLDPSRIVYAPNCANERFLPIIPDAESASAQALKDGDDVNIMYAGAIGEVQGLDTVLEAARLLHDQSHIKILIVGDGPSLPRLRRRASSLRLSNVSFLGRVPQAELPRLQGGAAIQLVALKDSPFLRHTTPSKIPALLFAGSPIVAVLEGDGADLVKASGSGVCVKPGDAPGLAATLLELASKGPEEWERMGTAGRRYYHENLSAEIACRRIVESLESVVKRS
jgi:glycosyltransferase involved in cell wall biosynthesis